VSFYGKMNKKHSYHIFFWSLIVLFIAIVGWWIWQELHAKAPRFDYLMITVNSEPQKILAGENVHFRPSDKVRIVKLSTDVPLNWNVRLIAMAAFDVNALKFREMSLASLLPDQNIFNHYIFRIEVKYRNRIMGHMVWDIQPCAEDWIKHADSIHDPVKRLSFLKLAYHILPDDQDIYRRLIDAMKVQKEWQQAAHIVEDHIHKTGSMRADLLELLDIYTAMSDKDGMVSVLKRLLKLDPDDISLRVKLAGLLEESGKIVDVIQQYKAMLGYFNKKDALPVYERLGHLYSKTDNKKNALFYYLKAVKLDKNNPDLYYSISDLYRDMGRKGLADSYLAKAVDLKKDDIDSRLALADDLIKKGNLARAEKYVMDVLQKKPSLLDALILMSVIKDKKGDKKGLVDTYKKILAIQPDNQNVLYNLGVLEYEKGDFDRSRDYFLRYLKKHPRDKDVHRLIFDIYRKQKDKKAAFHEAQILVTLMPHYIDAYRVIFKYLKNKANYGRIISLMNKAVKNNPKNVELRKYLAVAYLKSGNDIQAARQIENILKIRPKDTGLLFDLAALREKQGDIAGALAVYKRILDISPDNEKAENAYLQLRFQRVKQEEQIK